MQPLSRSQIVIIGFAVFVVVVIAGLATGIIPGLRRETERIPRITLTMWGVDDPAFFNDNLRAYEQFRNGIKVSYEKVSQQTFERDLVNALASGRAPDVIMFHHTWLWKHGDKIRPIDQSQLNLKTLRQIFPQVVEDDFVVDGFTYALPLYLDSLALLYNQDLYDKNGIVLPPKDWLEFQNLIPKLRQKTPENKLVRPAAALGGSGKTIDKIADLVSLLMMQAGAKMTDPDLTEATFSYADADRNPGLDALTFYLKFSDPNNLYYTWNEEQDYSLDSFAKGETAMIFGYNETRKNLRATNPFLNFRAGEMPQPTNTPESKFVNYADYWGLAVPHNSQNTKWAWDLILYLTTNDAIAEQYLLASDRPPATRTLIRDYLDHPELGVFAKQALTARSWPQVDQNRIAVIFSDMIKAILNRQLSMETALFQAADEVTAIIKERK